MKYVLLFSFFMLQSLLVYSQGGVHYQAVIRDAGGSILENAPVVVEVTINPSAGEPYNELISTTTNGHGILNIVIGENGNMSLDDLQWSSGEVSMDLEIRTGSESIVLEDQPIRNVPYAYYAHIAGTALNDAVDDADADPNNEFQDLQYNATTKRLEISQGEGIEMDPFISYWIDVPDGIYTPEDAFIGNPSSTPSLQLTRNKAEFHTTGSDPSSAWRADRLSFYSDNFITDIQSGELSIEGDHILRTYTNQMDTFGFTARASRILSHETTQSAYSFTASELPEDKNLSAKLDRFGVTAEDGIKYSKLFSDQLQIADSENGNLLRLLGSAEQGEMYLYYEGDTNVKLNGSEYGGELKVFSHVDPNHDKIRLFTTSGTGEGYIVTYGGNNEENVRINYANSNHGAVDVCDAEGIRQAGLMVNSFGQGVLYADVKNFVQPHPDKPGTSIWYASVEGPEVAAYERGTAQLVDGRAVVKYSDHFRIVANPETMTVTLTPHSSDTYGLAVIDKTEEGFVVEEFKGGGGNFAFDWEVKCKRRGYEDWQVEQRDSETILRDQQEENPD